MSPSRSSWALRPYNSYRSYRSARASRSLRPSIDLPSRFIGVWERVELLVVGLPVTSPGRAVWLEAGSACINLRIAGEPGPGGSDETAYAGTTRWDGQALVRSHEIDRHQVGQWVDRVQITLEGDDMIADGSLRGGDTLCRERWRPMTGVGGPWSPSLVAEAKGGLALRIGQHAAVIVDRGPRLGGVVAAYHVWDGLVWRTGLTVGDPVSVASLLPPLEPGAALGDGWRWRQATTLGQ
jgi:hypothetical protein